MPSHIKMALTRSSENIPFAGGVFNSALGRVFFFGSTVSLHITANSPLLSLGNENQIPKIYGIVFICFDIGMHTIW